MEHNWDFNLRVLPQISTFILPSLYSSYINRKKKWLECIRKAKVLPEDAFHTVKEYLNGWLWPLRTLSNWLKNLQRRVWHPHKLVFIFEILKESHRSKKSQEIRFWEFWRKKDWPLKFHKIFIIWSRKQLISESISRSSGKILTPSSDLF